MNLIKNILANNFNVKADEIKKLVGEVNINYYIKSGNDKYIFKESLAEQEIIEFSQDESDLLELLSTKIPTFFQKPVKSINGDFLVKDKKSNKLYRLFHFIEGELFSEVKHTESLFESFGDLLASMDNELLNQRYLSIMSRKYDWDILQFDLNIKNVKYIEHISDRKLIEYFHLQFHEVVRPKLPEMRYSIIHGDANDLNVLVKNNKISGIIDFGDSSYSILINELAVAITYALLGKKEPLKWATPIIKGYSKIIPLTETEIDILYYLIAARLSISLCHSALGRVANPENEYLTISEKPVLELLRKWITINPIKAADEFRKAANLPGIIKDTVSEDVEKRWKHLSKAFSLSYPKPIKMEKAAFQYMYDNLGNTYLDTRNNIPHVGHNHPKVVRAGQVSMAKLNTNTRYLYNELTEYSEKLLAKFPASLNKVFFVNSGSAASDLAIRLAMTHTQKPQMAVMEHGYHGNTQNSIDISHYKFSGKGGKGRADHILIATAPDTFRGKYTDEQTAGKMYAKDFLASITENKDKIAAFITEPIISAAGQVPMPKGYLNEIYDFIRNQGGVCISDEVQTGFGRLGTHFWGYEASEVVPDIVIIGKPMGNGHPMAAVVCTDQIADSFNNGMEFFSSFGGNPVSCVTGLAVIEVIEEENLMQNALEVGNYMITEFKNLQNKYDCIGDIRGSGLSLGVDFIKNSDTKEHNTELANKIVNELKLKNILIGTDGPYDNVFKIKPPLCFTKENTDLLIQEIEKVLNENFVN